MSLESAYSTSAPVKWKARKVSAKRDFFESSQPVVTHSSNLSVDRSTDYGKSIDELDITPDRQGCLELFQHKVGSQEKLVEVNKVIIKPHTLELEKVKPSIGADTEESVQLGSEFALDLDEVVNQVKVDDIENSMHECLRIRLYPSPKRRNIPVDRDFPIGLVQLAQQLEQEMNKPLLSTYDIESEQSLANTRKVIFDDMILVSDKLGMVVAHDQDESVKEASTYLTDLRISTMANVPRRRISAIRCFPPGCGRSAAYLSKEDLKRALADSKNHCLSCTEDEEEEQAVLELEEGKENDDVVMEEDEGNEDDVEVEVENEEEEGGEEDDAEVEEEEEKRSEEDDVEVGVVEEEEEEEDNVEVEVVVEEEGDEDSVRGEVVEEGEKDDDEVEVVEQEEVVIMCDDETETTETKFESERVVVLALSASRCPRSQIAGAKPTARGLKKGKEITTTGLKEEERVVVQALMASSRCPWRRQNQRRPTKPRFIR